MLIVDILETASNLLLATTPSPAACLKRPCGVVRTTREGLLAVDSPENAACTSCVEQLQLLVPLNTSEGPKPESCNGCKIDTLGSSSIAATAGSLAWYVLYSLFLFHSLCLPMISCMRRLQCMLSVPFLLICNIMPPLPCTEL